jgi:hypothetical protein
MLRVACGVAGFGSSAATLNDTNALMIKPTCMRFMMTLVVDARWADIL